MKLVVLGATGQTGKQVVQQALEGGHTVTAVVRTPSKMKITHENLKVIEGNIFNKESLTEIFNGNDAVVSCLGFNVRPQPVTGYTASAAAIVPAMREANVNKFVTMTAMFSDVSTASQAGFMVRWLFVPFLRPLLNNMHEMEKYLENSCSDINYTVVRPPGLVNGPKADPPINVTEDYVGENKSAMNRMNRADVAAFMLGCLKSDEYNKKMIAIETKK